MSTIGQAFRTMHVIYLSKVANLLAQCNKGDNSFDGDENDDVPLEPRVLLLH